MKFPAQVFSWQKSGSCQAQAHTAEFRTEAELKGLETFWSHFLPRPQLTTQDCTATGPSHLPLFLLTLRLYPRIYGLIALLVAISHPMRICASVCMCVHVCVCVDLWGSFLVFFLSFLSFLFFLFFLFFLSFLFSFFFFFVVFQDSFSE